MSAPMVAVEFPIEEAEALLNWTDLVSPLQGAGPVVRHALRRVEQAVKVERGSCGYAEQRERLRELTGQRIFVRTGWSGVFEGEVREVGDHALTICDDPRYGSIVFNLDDIQSFALVDWQKGRAA